MVRFRLALEVLSGMSGRSESRVLFMRSGNVLARDNSGPLAPCG